MIKVCCHRILVFVRAPSLWGLIRGFGGEGTKLPAPIWKIG